MTDLKVVELQPKKLERNDALVESLEAMLAQAKEGRIIGLCAVTLDEKNLVTYMKVGIHSFGTIGGLQILSMLLINYITRGVE
jgi:hypothetical protein